MSQSIRTILFNTSALLVVVGAALYLTRWEYAPYLFSIGSAGIAISYLTLPIEGLSIRLKRLHRLNVFAGLLMIIASGFMFKNRTEWILCLTIAAIFQLYTAFVSPKSEEK